MIIKRPPTNSGSGIILFEKGAIFLRRSFSIIVSFRLTVYVIWPVDFLTVETDDYFNDLNELFIRFIESTVIVLKRIVSVDCNLVKLTHYLLNQCFLPMNCVTLPYKYIVHLYQNHRTQSD